MESISPVTVFLLLQYIKDISVPIPSDLLSVPLRQRHHFLNLSFTADPASFLCWPNPSTNAAQTIHSLQSIELDTESPAFDYRYVADSEHIYAHVSVVSGAARLVFMWDPSDVQWKYHDAASMPFPSTCYESVHDALAHASSDPIDSSFVPPMSGVEENDDSYWNMYGQEDSDLENNNRRQPSGSNEVSEDAYWAQYSEVQGSADSTIPSPAPIPPSKRRLGSQPPEAATANGESNNQAVQLAARLADVSRNYRIPEEPDDISPLIGTPASTSPAPSLRGLNNLPVSQVEETENGIFNPAYTSSPMDEAAKEAIRGIYRLWKASAGSGKSADDFLQLVDDAI